MRGITDEVGIVEVLAAIMGIVIDAKADVVSVDCVDASHGCRAYVFDDFGSSPSKYEKDDANGEDDSDEDD